MMWDEQQKEVLVKTIDGYSMALQYVPSHFNAKKYVEALALTFSETCTAGDFIDLWLKIAESTGKIPDIKSLKEKLYEQATGMPLITREQYHAAMQEIAHLRQIGGYVDSSGLACWTKQAYEQQQQALSGQLPEVKPEQPQIRDGKIKPIAELTKL